MDAFLGYRARPAHRDVPLFPGRAGSALRRILPGFLGERIAGARLRWTPESVEFHGELLDHELSTSRFDRIISSPEDSLVVATRAPRRQVAASARLGLRPFPSLTAEANLVSGRDLLAVHELAEDHDSRELLAGERRQVAGVDLGWEVDRHLQTKLLYQPRFADWARTRVDLTTIYLSERNSDLIEMRHTPDGTALVLLRNVDGHRSLTADLSVDPAAMVEERGGGMVAGTLAPGPDNAVPALREPSDLAVQPGARRSGRDLRTRVGEAATTSW